jgi:hypothetical protein
MLSLLAALTAIESGHPWVCLPNVKEGVKRRGQVFKKKGSKEGVKSSKRRGQKKGSAKEGVKS